MPQLNMVGQIQFENRIVQLILKTQIFYTFKIFVLCKILG